MKIKYKNEETIFLQTLHHDGRCGNWIQGNLLDGTMSHICRWKSKSIKKIQCQNSYHIYGTLNTFFGRKRLTEKLCNLSGYYIDLDCHNVESAYQAEKATMSTYQLLKELFDNGTLLRPTMITATGRGLGLFYVFDHSIAATEGTIRFRLFYDKVYQSLLTQYRSVLEKQHCIMVVDTSVTDATRLVRIPGTYNPKIGLYCRLVEYNTIEDDTPMYFSIEDIIQGNHLEMGKGDSNYKKNKSHISNPAMKKVQEARIASLKRLQSLRGSQCVGKCREKMCFIIFQSFVQLYNTNSAVQALIDFNDAFPVPLSEKELSHIIRVTKNSNQGFYKYTTDKIIQDLSITPEELYSTDFSQAITRKIKREIKEQKRRKILSLLTDTTITYQEISDIAGVSKRTVSNIAKKSGISRYKKRSDNSTVSS